MKSKIESEKIDGYDRWEVTSAVDNLKRSEEIKSDPKFLKVVLKQMGKEADKLDKTAELVRNTKEKLNEVFKK